MIWGPLRAASSTTSLKRFFASWSCHERGRAFDMPDSLAVPPDHATLILASAAGRARGTMVSPATVTRWHALPWPSAYLIVGNTRDAVIANASETSARGP